LFDCRHNVDPRSNNKPIQLKTWRILHHYFPAAPQRYADTFKAIAYIDNLQLKAKSNYETSQLYEPAACEWQKSP